MKVIAINGSPKKEGNTNFAIECVANELRKENIEVETIHIGNKMIRGCLGCNKCVEMKNEKCIINDEVNGWIQKMKEADGIILGTPTYYSAIAGTMKSFLDRAIYVTSVNDGMLRHKVGAAVVAVRRSGGVPTFNQLNNYINYSEMIMPTSNYWNVIHGTAPGDAKEDIEGMQIMSVLGKNMAMILKQNKGVESPQRVEKVFTNFIR